MYLFNDYSEHLKIIIQLIYISYHLCKILIVYFLEVHSEKKILPTKNVELSKS